MSFLSPEKRDVPRCSGCSEPLSSIKPEERALHETVTRIVRPGKQYGWGGPKDGARVQVELRHLSDRTTIDTTMSLEEWDAIIAAKQAATAAPPQPGRLAQMVEASLAASKREVQAAIERGKQHLINQRNKIAAEVLKLGAERTPSIDAEQPTAPRPVE